MRAPLAFAAALLVGVATGLTPADAGCKRFGFLVNDYGKDGPTKDAKALLDKHVADWAAQQGIKDYKVGKKSVSCELFLNFIVFDEHTCTASATVCWGGDESKIQGGTEANAGAAGSGLPPTPVRKAKAEAGHKKAANTVAETAPAEAATADAPSAEAAAEASAGAATQDASAPAETTMTGPVDSAPLADTSTAAAPHADNDAAAPLPNASAVETGALAHETAPATDGAAQSGDAADKTKAAEAASAAAAAAERAAAAAETAANAAKEAAAAAVAASAAGRGGFVPPLGEAALSDKTKSRR